MTRNESAHTLRDAVFASMPPGEQRAVVEMIATGATPAQALAALAERYPALVARAKRMAEEMVAEIEAPE
jgi:hypothetical protein